MSAAQKFIAELQAGNLTEAIEVIKTDLQEKTATQISERRQQTMIDLGFVVEMKDDNDEESENDENGSDDKKDKEDDKDDE